MTNYVGAVVAATALLNALAGAQEPKAAPGEGARAKAFIAAFNKGDAKAVASFWTPEASYIDQAGREYKGRADIEKLYEKVFAASKGATLSIHVTSAREVAPGVAIEDGFTHVKPADGGPGSVARFTAVLVKRDGEWSFESVRDSVARPPSNAGHLEPIDWLVGDWVGEAEKGESSRASYAWAENQNFIVCTFATTLNGVPVVGGTQWIAWDAIDKQIRSFSFYSGGGFGEAVWSKQGDKWLLKTTARTAEGKTLTATNVLSRLDGERLSLQLTNVTVNGERMPDLKPVVMKRTKADRQ